jgi:hypothetical protein
MAACKVAACVALAGASGYCAPHAAGYRLHDGVDELRCEQCRGAILKGQYFRRVGESIQHVKDCKVHPDTMKARAEALAKA